MNAKQKQKRLSREEVWDAVIPIDEACYDCCGTGTHDSTVDGMSFPEPCATCGGDGRYHEHNLNPSDRRGAFRND